MSEEALHRENQILQLLALYGNEIYPSIRIVFDTGDAEISENWSNELINWSDSQDENSLPRAIGFIHSKLRNAIFPGSNPVPPLNYIGEISIQTGRADLRYVVGVLNDGTVRNRSISPLAQCIRGDTDLIYEPYASIIIESCSSVNAFELYQSVIRSFDQKINQVTIRTYTSNTEQEIDIKNSLPKAGRISFYLDDNKQIAITGLVTLSNIRTSEGAILYDWSLLS